MRKKSLILSSWSKAFLVFVMSLCAMLATGQEARKALTKPAPSYPDVARRLNLAGVVKIEVVVGTDGEIKGTKVIGGHPLLVDATLKALREWKYERAGSETKLELEFKFQP